MKQLPSGGWWEQSVDKQHFLTSSILNRNKIACHVKTPTHSREIERKREREREGERERDREIFKREWVRERDKKVLKRERERERERERKISTKVAVFLLVCWLQIAHTRARVKRTIDVHVKTNKHFFFERRLLRRCQRQTCWITSFSFPSLSLSQFFSHFSTARSVPLDALREWAHTHTQHDDCDFLMEPLGEQRERERERLGRGWMTMSILSCRAAGNACLCLEVNRFYRQAEADV